MPTKPLNIPTQIELEQFMAEEAHDLRSPFNQVIGFGKMLINTVKDQPLSDVQKEDLNTVYRSAMRAFIIMNALIDIARINRQEKIINASDANIQQLIEHSLSQWKKFHPGDSVEIQHKIVASTSIIQCDELLTQQIISGFIAYVSMFCKGGTTVTLTVEEEADAFAFTFASKGTKAQTIQEMDLKMMGYVNRASVELQGGSLRRAEENDDGAVIEFALPKA